MTQPLGLLGGTFDPIHFGHLRTALELHAALGLSQVRLIPCCEPVHRAPPEASPQQRLAMLRLAVQDEPALAMDDIEVRRGGRSWTIDTLQAFRQAHPATPFCFIIGIDALPSVPQWRQFDQILDITHLVVAYRPCYPLPGAHLIDPRITERQVHEASALSQKTAGSVLFHPVTQLEISATAIRQQLACQGNPRFLLPDNVMAYARQNRLYG